MAKSTEAAAVDSLLQFAQVLEKQQATIADLTRRLEAAESQDQQVKSNRRIRELEGRLSDVSNEAVKKLEQRVEDLSREVISLRDKVCTLEQRKLDGKQRGDGKDSGWYRW